MSDIAVKATEKTVERLAAQLPIPKGFKILCAVPNVESTWNQSKIAKADESIKVEEQTTIVLYVISMGPDAYQNKDKFPTGAWCKEGDFVITRGYAGTRLKIHGKEFRLINDDTVEAVVDNPVGIGRAG
jgi:co-chaperonin GroES (HSP10)